MHVSSEVGAASEEARRCGLFRLRFRENSRGVGLRYQRRNHRPDANQAVIVAGLRKAGASVFTIGRPVDLLVGFRGATLLFELKDGKQVASRRKLGDTQVEFFETWNGGPALKIESLEDGLKAIGLT